MRWLALSVGLTICAALPSIAQNGSTLADIRQDLTVLNVEIQRLRTELSTTSGATVPSGGSVLDRVTLIEQELQRLTARTEELEFRIARIVADGTNRIGDLEFRLLELEGGDVSQLPETSTLGGPLPETTPVPQPAPAPSTDVAVGEQADFEEAQALLASGDPGAAAETFQRLIETYPGSPFATAALIGRGDALSDLGDTREAGRSYLAAYNADPQGATAPVALLKLGQGLTALGETDAACTILAQLSLSFPDSEAGQQAGPMSTALGCL